MHDCGGQPTLTSLGGGSANNITNSTGGIIYLGGGSASGQVARWAFNPAAGTLTQLTVGGSGNGRVSADGQFLVGAFANTAPSVRGNTATGVSPAFNPSPTLVASTTLPGDAEFGLRRWSAATNTITSLGGLPIVGSLGVFGSGSSGQPSGSFLSGHGISSTGRFTTGLVYVSTVNSAGTSVSANSFRWRPFLWDGNSATMTVLPTPFRTTSNTLLRCTGNAYAVSTDDSVVVGATEHNIGGTGDDSARLCVWRFNLGTGTYDLTYLDDGAASSTPSSVAMNAAGTVIVGRGASGVNRWVWNAGTSAWARTTLFSTLTPAQPSWLPAAVTSCGVPANLGGVLAMNDNGSVVVGQASWSTCGTTLNTVLSVVDGCGGFEFGCNDNAGITGCSNQSIIDNYMVMASTPIFMRVGANSASVTGSGNLTIDVLGCDTIDFNGNGVFPEDQDVIEFFNVLAGAACPTGTCQDIDFNNNGVFPEDRDVTDFFNVLAGGQCP